MGVQRRLLVGALLVAMATPGLAQGKPAAAKPAASSLAPGPAEDAAALAKAHFERALDAYREGRYERAVQELEHAVALDPDGKDLYYNLGLVHEKLGNLDRALFYFRRYLELETLPAERERVEVMVQRLAGAEASANRSEGEATDEPSALSSNVGFADQPSPKRGRWDEWVWISGGLAVASLAVGVVYGLRATVTHPGGSPKSGPGQSAGDLQRDAAQAHDYAVVADVSFGMALVSGAVASLLYFGREAEPTQPVGHQSAPQAAFPRSPAPGVHAHSFVVAVPYGITYEGRF